LILLLTFFTANVGLVVNAVFEAWLVSVGTPLCVFFWVNVVFANALADRVLKRERVLEKKPASETEPLPVPLPTRQIPGRPKGAVPQSGGFTY
jgi:hypothetical protein